MKSIKLLSLFSMLLLLWACNNRQQVDFKVLYKPQTKYTQTLEKTSGTVIHYAGPDSMLQKIKDQGIANPTVASGTLKMESVFATGKLTDATHFPITLTIVKTTNNDGQKDIADGTVIYGLGTVGGNPFLDSVADDSLTPDFKNALLKSLQNTITQISAPNKKVAVGDSFSVSVPLTMPIGGVSLLINLTTKYKLINIVNGMATFNLSQVYTLASPGLGTTVKATGTGSGQLQYDIANNFYTRYMINNDLTFNLQADSLHIDLNTKSGILQTTTISAN